MVLPDTAEHPGRYSDGSHIRFSELYVIQSLFRLKSMPGYCGFWGLMLFAGLFEVDIVSSATKPYSE